MEGREREARFVVAKEDTALIVGSGTLLVLATPRLISKIENLAMSMVQEELGEGETTVGTNVNINHIRATPVGCCVKVVSKVVKVDGRKIVYEVCAYDDVEKIAEGTHERYILDVDRFFLKAQKKLQ